MLKLNQTFERHKAEILLLAFALLIKLVASFFLFSHNGPGLTSEGDASGYLAIAQSVAAGEGFRMDGMLSAWRAPFYPLFLSVFYLLRLPLITVALVQILLLSFGSIFVYKIGSAFFNKKAGIIAAGLFSVEPLLLVYGNMALSESLFVFLILASVYTLTRYLSEEKLSLIILSSILAGVAALTRPIALYLPLLIVTLLVFKNILEKKGLKSLLKPAAIYLTLFFFTLFPWLLRNALVFGHFSISNQGANEIYMERVPIVIAAEEHTDYNNAFIINQERLAKTIPNFDPAILGNTFEYNEFLAKESWRILRQDIPAVLSFHALAALSYFHTTGFDYALHYFGVPESARTNFTDHILKHDWRGLITSLSHAGIYDIVRLLGYALWLIANLVIVISVVLDLKHSRQNLFTFSFLVALILYFSLFSIGPHTQARYRIPTYPFLFILIGFAGNTLLRPLNKKLSRIINSSKAQVLGSLGRATARARGIF